MVFLAELQARKTGTIFSPKEFPAWGKVMTANRLSNRQRKANAKDNKAGLNDKLSAKLLSEEQMLYIINRTRHDLSMMEERHLDNGSLTKDEQKWYINCLITLMLCLGLAPRHQVLVSLTPSTLLPPLTGANDSSTQYLIRMSAHQSKISEPVVLLLPAELTGHLRWYQRTLVPSGYTESIFLQRGQQPRQNFSDGTKDVTQVLIGKPVTCHSFRGTVATIFSEHPDVGRRALARIQNHSFSTHDTDYTRHQNIRHQARFQGYLLKKADEMKQSQSHAVVGAKRPRQEPREEEEEKLQEVDEKRVEQCRAMMGEKRRRQEPREKKEQ